MDVRVAVWYLDYRRKTREAAAVKQNEAAVMTGVRRMELRGLPMPEAGPGEALVRTAYVGVCGSDAHFFASGERKGKPFALPFILGHEFSGYVEAVGAGVRDLRPGDRVTFEPQQTCGVCAYCRSGRYNLCPEVRFPSVPPYDGLLRRYAALPAGQLHKLPEGVSQMEGAMIEPLAVGLAAAARGRATVGMTAVLLGAGCIGLMTLLACRTRGVSRVIVADLSTARLRQASRLGADEVIDASKEDVPAAVAALTGGEGAQLVFETAGSPHTAAMTERVLARGGTVVLVGNVGGQTPYPFLDLMYKEGELRTIYRYCNNFGTAIRAVASGRIPLGAIEPAVFPFARTDEAFTRALDGKGDFTKAMIEF